MFCDHKAMQNPPNAMNDQTIAIRAQKLSKCYRIYDKPRDRLIQGILGERVKLYREFWALRDVSFELNRGRTLGVVGRNGSGKSTLLQLLCGTLSATSGTVSSHGRIGALLELGSGFNPEFSGLENVYLNGRILGLSSKEVDDKLDKILAFADIGEFVHQPIKSYSSGMAVRLAFAVQAHVDPEILIVDEALAVGDELFQKKCYTHLSRLKEDGCAILLVTHSCGQIIQHCDEALLLHQGRLRLMGQPSIITTTYQQLAGRPDHEWDEVITRKQELLSGKEHAEAKANIETNKPAADKHDPNLIPKTREIYASNGAEILSVTMESQEGQPMNQFAFGSHFQIRFRYRSQQSIPKLCCGCNIARVSGQRITGQVFPAMGESISVNDGETWDVIYQFGSGLHPGTYFVGGGIWQAASPGQFIHRVVDYCAFRILESPVSQPIGLCDLSAGPAELIRPPEAPQPAGT